MAKVDYADMLDRHMEKLVLGACALLLLWAIGAWGLSSSRAIKIATGRETAQVPPERADAAMLEVAKRVETWHESAKPSARELSDTPAEIEKLRRPSSYFDRKLVQIVSERPPIGDGAEGPKGPNITKTWQELADVTPGMTRTWVRTERELPQTNGKLADVDVSRVVGIYPLSAALSAWKEVLKDQLYVGRIDIVGVEVQRCEGAIGAKWENITPQTIEGLRQPLVIVDRTGQPVQVDRIAGLPPYTGSNAAEVKRVLDDLRQLQEEIVQPDYPSIWCQQGQWGPWQVHLPQEPLEAAGAQLVDVSSMGLGSGRAGLAASVRTPVRRQNLAAPPVVSGTAPGVSATVPRRPTRTPGAARPKRGTFSSLDFESREADFPPRTSPRDVAGMPTRISPRDIRGLDADELRRTEYPPSRTTPTGRPLGETGTTETPAVQTREVPDFNDQLARGQVLVWIHDPTVKPMKAYRYRIRLKLANPLLMLDQDMAEANRDDAKKPDIATPWSQWSDPLFTPPATRFFLVTTVPSQGVSPATGRLDDKVLVAVFARALGQRVTETFTLTRGQTIGATVEKTVPNPAWQPARSDSAEASGQTQFVTTPVSFSTGSVVVDIDFTKTVLRSGFAKKTSEMIYANEAGQLQKCTLVTDLPEDSQIRKDYEKFLAEIPQRIVAAESTPR